MYIALESVAGAIKFQSMKMRGGKTSPLSVIFVLTMANIQVFGNMRWLTECSFFLPQLLQRIRKKSFPFH